MSSSVEDWLRSLGFIHYTQAFLDNGYDELEICKEIGKEDLDAIGVRNFKDRTDILNAVDRLKQSGTAVYFVLEGDGNSEPLQAQPERDTYPPVSLKMMLFDKLEEDKIDLTVAPYSLPDGSEGSLSTLVTIYADKFYTYEDHVLTALQSLRQRQVEKEGAFDDSPAQIPAPQAPSRSSRSSRHSSKHKSRSSEERDDDEGHGAISEDEFHHRSFSSEDQTSPTRIGINPADYLDVDSPAQRKKEKKRRKVERNTKLSRSLDSLKELHVNVEPKPREREPSSLKSRPFKFKWLHGSKKKNHHNEIKKQPLEKKLSNPNKQQDYDMLASAIKMGEEDRMALMIMVKQGELTVEEAVEQLKRYEEDCKREDFLKSKGDEKCDHDEKSGNKPKLKRGIFGKSTKRKSNSRPSSEFIASEMTTMSEEDRINLMRNVKAGEMSVDQALKRFISYEEKHKKSDSDDMPVRESPKLPKGTGFSRISIKRVSGVLSSSLRLPSTTANEPNAVFYTEDGASADGSVSSGDEVLGATESSPAPSPKRLLTNIQGLNQSQHSSSSSVDSVEKAEEKQAPQNTPPHRQPNFLSEMKVVLGKQAQPVESKTGEGGEDVLHKEQKPASNKNEKPRPPLPDRKGSLPMMETQKVILPINPTGSLKRAPDIPSRPGATVAVPHRPPPPIPLRPSPKNNGDQRKPPTKSKADETESNNFEAGATKLDPSKNEADQSRSTETEMSGSDSQAYLEPVEVEGAVQRPRNKPPPLPPRPCSPPEEPETGEARSVETQTSPESQTSTQLDKSSKTAASTEEVYKLPPKPEAIDKPQLKPKPKPRPRPKRSLTPDKLDDPYQEPPPPRPVERGSTNNLDEPNQDPLPPRPVERGSTNNLDEPYRDSPPPRPVERGSANNLDEPYTKVPPPRPVERGSANNLDEPYTKVPPPRPVERGSAGDTRTRGEASSSDSETNISREEGRAVNVKRTEPRASQNEEEGDSNLKPSPVPAPRIKRASHSLGEMIDRKLHIENIDLTQEPYTDCDGRWGVPVNLVDRYAEELNRSHEELAGVLERTRVRRLRKAGRQFVACKVSELDFTRDTLGTLGTLDEWLTSLGLPMYTKSLVEVEYDNMADMPYMEERHFQYAGISDPRHMRRLLESVERMPR